MKLLNKYKSMLPWKHIKLPALAAVLSLATASQSFGVGANYAFMFDSSSNTLTLDSGSSTVGDTNQFMTGFTTGGFGAGFQRFDVTTFFESDPSERFNAPIYLGLQSGANGGFGAFAVYTGSSPNINNTFLSTERDGVIAGGSLTLSGLSSANNAFLAGLSAANTSSSGLGGFDTYRFSSAAPAVPEPSTYALFGMGVLGCFFVARRRKTHVKLSC